MTTELKSIASNTFTSALIEEGSWGERDIGTHASTMELFDYTDEPTRGLIEWDIPSIEGTEHIGLWYELRDGVRHLCDYDGVCSLPREAVALLERTGIVVDEEFK